MYILYTIYLVLPRIPIPLVQVYKAGITGGNTSLVMTLIRMWISMLISGAWLYTHPTLVHY